MKTSTKRRLQVVRQHLYGDLEPEYVVDTKVQEFMEENDITVDEMAALSGVSKTVIENTGQQAHSNMHITNAYRLMKAMGEDDLVEFAFESDGDEEDSTVESRKNAKGEGKKESRQERADELTVSVPGDVDDLTDIEAEALAYFRQIEEDTGAPPTLNELSTAMGYEQDNGVYETVKSLHEKGYLHKNNNSYQRVYQLSSKAATVWNADWEAIRGF